jgi:hypothetical protein
VAEHQADKAERDDAAIVAAVRDFHHRWGEADCDDLDQLDLWEQLGAILR